MIDRIIKDEVDKLVTSVLADVTDPQHKARLAQITMDLAAVTVRQAHGEDCTAALQALRAEASNYAAAFALRTGAATEAAWIGFFARVLGVALGVA